MTPNEFDAILNIFKALHYEFLGGQGSNSLGVGGQCPRKADLGSNAKHLLHLNISNSMYLHSHLNTFEKYNFEISNTFQTNIIIIYKNLMHFFQYLRFQA